MNRRPVPRADDIDGGADRDRLFGNRGNDRILGGDDNDWIFGNRDDDILDGNDGNDKLWGNLGDDTLYGGPGTDVLVGGFGSDTTSQNGNSGLSFTCGDCGEIHGAKWTDIDADGVRDTGEPGLAGVTVYLDLNNNGVYDSGEPTTLTMADNPSTLPDEAGEYWLTGLGIGSYRVREIVPSGYIQTWPSSLYYAVTLAAGDVVAGRDFGNATECRPRADGLGCEPSGCASADTECLPGCARFYEAEGRAVVEECECRSSDECHVVVSPEPGVLPRCEGTCPPDQECVQTITEVPGTQGVYDVCCNCEPLETCAPTADGSACEAGTCTDAGDECRPKCVNYDDCTGEITVIDCDCAPPGDCHVDLSGGPGVQPTCTGACPAGFVCEERVEENCEGGVDICCQCLAVTCTPSVDQTECAPHNCTEEDDECIPSVITVTHECVGGSAAGSPCLDGGDCPGGSCDPVLTVDVCDCVDPDDCHVAFDPQSGAYCASDCPEGWECELVQSGDQYWCDCVPGACEPTPDGLGCEATTCPESDQQCDSSLVAITLTCVGGGSPGIPCFSDADCSGGACQPSGRIAECDCMTADTCHVLYDPATGPYCEGVCPDGETCALVNEGSLYYCECEPDPECEPTENGSACEPHQCVDPVETCVQTVIAVIDTCDGGSASGAPCIDDGDCPGGVCRPSAVVNDCDCLGPDDCHVEFDPDVGPFCGGVCPCDEDCELIAQENQYYCECVPRPESCTPLADGSGCTSAPCDDPVESCIPQSIELTSVCVGGSQDGTPCTSPADCPNGMCETAVRVLVCDCASPEDCHVNFDAAVGPYCEGTCDTGDPCKLVGVDTDVPPDGVPDRYECDCVVGCCLPDGTCLSVASDECAAIGGTEVPNCLGDTDFDGVDDACVEECRALPDGSGCDIVDCQDGTICLPSCATFDPITRESSVIDCECWTGCELQLNPGMEPQCMSDCPPGETCEDVTYDPGTGLWTYCCFECRPEGPGPAQACCLADGCEHLDQQACFERGGTPRGPGSRCRGDCDCDDDVDLVDYPFFATCMTGPGDVTAPAHCDCYQSDDDLDFDLKDFAAFQRAFSPR